MARKATVVYGTLSAPWSMFADAAINLSQQFLSQDHDQVSFLQQFAALPAWTQARSDTGDALEDFSANVLSIEYTRREHTGTSTVEILSLLQRFRARRATDARDKVFALYGLASAPVYCPLDINYAMTEQEVFTNTTIHVIHNTQSLSILHGNMVRPELYEVRRLPDMNSANRLPSWVVDWSVSPDDSLMEL